MSKLRDRLVNLIAIGVPISVHCPICDRPKNVEVTYQWIPKWENLARKISP